MIELFSPAARRPMKDAAADLIQHKRHIRTYAF
jgi:hypothetical protein